MIPAVLTADDQAPAHRARRQRQKKREAVQRPQLASHLRPRAVAAALEGWANRAVVTALEATASFKLLTFAIHVGATVGILILQREARGYSGQIAVHIAIMHAAVLLGLWGPKVGDSRFWWVPSPVHEPRAVLAFTLLALVHYLGTGMIFYHYREAVPCVMLNSAEVFWGAADNRTANGSAPLSDVVGASAAFFNCTIPSNSTEEWTGPGCDLCGAYCAPCPIGFAQEWYQSFDDPSAVTLDDALQIHIDGSGCSYDEREKRWVVYWSFLETLWFCVVLLTTVGYGNTFVPTTDTSRQFTLVFAVYGLVIFGFATASASEVLAAFEKRAASAVDDAVQKEMSWYRRAVRGLPKRPPKPQDKFEPPPIYKVGRGLFLNFTAFVCLNYVGAGIFSHLEDDWHFVDGMYHSMMTATTIGLGDIAPQTVGGRIYGIVHMLASVILFGRILGTILDCFELRAQMTKKEEMLRKSLDVELITSLDKNGDGVDKTEFVLGMLEVLGVLEESDYRPFLAQFARLDTTGDGRLTRDDLVKVVEQNKQTEDERKKAGDPSLGGPYAQRLRRHALELTAPAFIASFSFAVYAIYGLVLFAGGMMHGIAIGSILGSAPRRRNFHISACFVAAGAGCFCFSVCCILLFVSDTGAYLDMDNLLSSMIGELGEDGLTKRPSDMSAEEQAAVRKEWVDLGQRPGMQAMLCLYVVMFLWAIAIDVKTIVCCIKAAQELDGAAGGGREMAAADAASDAASDAGGGATLEAPDSLTTPPLIGLPEQGSVGPSVAPPAPPAGVGLQRKSY